jgi:hypothetical protein
MQEGKRRMAMVNKAAEKRSCILLQQHRRQCPLKNGSRREVGPETNMTTISSMGGATTFKGDDTGGGLITSVDAAAFEGAQQQPYPQEW